MQSDRFKEIKWRLVGIAGKRLIDFLFWRSRIQTVGYEKVRDLVASRRYIFAFWHSRILLLSYVYKGLGASILVSKSEDGEIIARVLERQGQQSVRGSTRKGGLRALALLIRSMRDENRPGVVVPDGPQGPRYRAQPGVIVLAKQTGYPIIPLTYSSRKVKVFNSWDRFMLPFPASEGRVIYGEPIHVPPQTEGEDLERYRTMLEKELNRITAAADNFFGRRMP
jgi:lysophospholipid acyltransferase (LPLAT)-like uncharacterized protein